MDKTDMAVESHCTSLMPVKMGSHKSHCSEVGGGYGKSRRLWSIYLGEVVIRGVQGRPYKGGY